MKTTSLNGEKKSESGTRKFKLSAMPKTEELSIDWHQSLVTLKYKPLS
jgi:hypothetical protein